MAVFFCLSLSFLFFFADATPNLDLPPANAPPPYGVVRRQDATPFRPSVAVIIAVLTTMFSITFLLLLYAKHCKRTSVTYSDQYSTSTGGAHFSSAARKNSGIDRSVIESLPIFRFGSLMGQKDGLECAVCLNRFEASEVLRLLPKCKHAFHVECVDTWLDAHSTCPLCRYRVDPEDILLVEDHAKMLLYPHNDPNPIAPPTLAPPPAIKEDKPSAAVSAHRFKRVFGRHSSAGERGSNGFVQIVLQRPGEGLSNPASFRRSLDSLGQKKRSESVTVGCFDRGRKDGLLLSDDGTGVDRSRFEHRIVVSGRSSRSTSSGVQLQLQQRWSDVQPLDLLYLQSEMIIGRGLASASCGGGRPSSSGVGRKQQMSNVEEDSTSGSINGGGSGRGVINERSVSEITGLSRFSSRENSNGIGNRRYRDRDDDRNRAGVVTRWLAWIASQSRPHDSSQDATSAAP